MPHICVNVNNCNANACTAWKLTAIAFYGSPMEYGRPLYFHPVVCSCSCSSSFFLAQSQPPQSGCMPYLHTWCGLCANLRRGSETCCTWLAANKGRKKVAKNRHLDTIAQFCRAISSQLRYISKSLSSIMSSTCRHNMANFGPLAAEIDPVFWAPLQISTGFASWQRYCTASIVGVSQNLRR